MLVKFLDTTQLAVIAHGLKNILGSKGISAIFSDEQDLVAGRFVVGRWLTCAGITEARQCHYRDLTTIVLFLPFICPTDIFRLSLCSMLETYRRTRNNSLLYGNNYVVKIKDGTGNGRIN